MARSLDEVHDLAYVHEMLDRLRKVAAGYAGTDLLVYTLTMARTEAEDLLRDGEIPTHTLLFEHRQIHPDRKQ